MPRSFLLTNRRYIPTPPPADVAMDCDNNGNTDANVISTDATTANNRSIFGQENSYVTTCLTSSEMIVAQILISQSEQTEAVDLALHKRDIHSVAVNNNYNIINNNIVRNPESFDNSNSVGSGLDGESMTEGRGSNCLHLPEQKPRPSLIYSISSSDNNHGNSFGRKGDVPISDNISNNVGMDLSLKADQRDTPPSQSEGLVECEAQDKSSLSDGDSDSGCSSQNEARGHLPPEVEYSWAECQAHFSLLYDLMTQGPRKVPGKEAEQQNPNASSEASDLAPYDYSQTPARDNAQEPPVLYELMTESPRKSSGRDVPDHALEVEVAMQQYSQSPHQQYQQPHQQTNHQQSSLHQYLAQPQQQQPTPVLSQYEDHRPTKQEVAQDRGLAHVNGAAPRYEPRRSLNDLLYAAGLPPVSSPSPVSLSPSESPLAGDDVHSCEECGKRYSTSSNLARHRQTHRSHGDKKARKCPHCEKVYVSMPAFSMHVRTHNQGCACPHCGKRFSRPWLLQGHIRTHTGEKPFACPQCGKSFADKSNLRAHIQTHSSEKPYVCGRCGKAFALKSYLYKHEESSCMRGERFRPLRRQVSAEC